MENEKERKENDDGDRFELANVWTTNDLDEHQLAHIYVQRPSTIGASFFSRTYRDESDIEMSIVVEAH